MPGSKRRAKGEGTLEQLPSGLWRARTRVDGQKVNGKAAPTRKEALANLKASVAAASAGASGSLSLSRSARAWLESRRKHLSPTTLKSYGIWISALDRDPLGAILISKISESDLRLWASRQDLSPHSMRKRLGFVHQMMRLHGNHARYKPPTAERHSRRPLTPEESGKILKAALAHPDSLTRIGTLLCLQCGLRLSEACGIRHEDREGDGIRIRRVVVRVTGEIRVKAKPKTAKSGGWIPLPPLLQGEIGGASGYVLGDGSRPIVPDSLTVAIKRLAASVGVVGISHFGPHTLRRTYGMHLLETGIDVVTAADLMRHDPRMLLEEYARTRKDLKVEAVRRAYGSG